MAAAIKAVLAAILAAAALFIVTQLVFFFPFYMTIITETFSLANVAAYDNYVKQSYYDNSLEGLRERPIFNKAPSSIKIEILNADNRDAVGDDDEFYYNSYEGIYLPGGGYKPYRQRGEPITVNITAVYPLEISLWGRPLRREIPVSFSMTTIGLRYYKDLHYDLEANP